MFFKVRQCPVLKPIRHSLATDGLLAHTSNHLGDVDERTYKIRTTINTKLQQPMERQAKGSDYYPYNILTFTSFHAHLFLSVINDSIEWCKYHWNNSVLLQCYLDSWEVTGPRKQRYIERNRWTTTPRRRCGYNASKSSIAIFVQMFYHTQ